MIFNRCIIPFYTQFALHNWLEPVCYIQLSGWFTGGFPSPFLSPTPPPLIQARKGPTFTPTLACSRHSDSRRATWTFFKKALLAPTLDCLLWWNVTRNGWCNFCVQFLHIILGILINIPALKRYSWKQWLHSYVYKKSAYQNSYFMTA